MKNLFSTQAIMETLKLFPVIICFLTIFWGCDNNDNDPLPPVFELNTITTGLAGPMGLEVDPDDNIWVAIPGTANNDGKVMVIDADGNKYDAIVNLPSQIHQLSGELEGPAHLLLDQGMMYVLAANYLYQIDVSNFSPGQPAIDASALSGEDIAAFVLNYPFVNNYHDSHPYNMAKGPDGDLYITDAGANAVLHRNGPGDYAVLAEVPPITNPSSIGPPMVQSVPTGILFDGEDFLVTTLLGFPFPAGKATVYKISLQGNLSVYQDGFTCLVDLAPGFNNRYLVLQYATFSPPGFSPKTGGLYSIDGTSTIKLADSLNMPVGIKQVDETTWFISSMGDGSILKATYL